MTLPTSLLPLLILLLLQSEDGDAFFQSLLQKSHYQFITTTANVKITGSYTTPKQRLFGIKCWNEDYDEGSRENEASSSSSFRINYIPLILLNPHDGVLLPGESKTIQIPTASISMGTSTQSQEGWSFHYEDDIEHDYEIHNDRQDGYNNNRNDILLAIGYMFGNTDDGVRADANKKNHDDEWYVMQIGTLCQVQVNQKTKKECVVSLHAFGRIKLDGEFQLPSVVDETFPITTASIEIVREELGGSIKKAILVTENINLLLQNIHQMEQKLQRQSNLVKMDQIQEPVDDDKQESSIWIRYQMAYQTYQSIVVQSNNVQNWMDHQCKPYQWINNHRITTPTIYNNITAMSWTVFTAIASDIHKTKYRRQSNNNDYKEEIDYHRYRIRALDWDNLLERLKLAQYMLREIELRLQGKFMFHYAAISENDTTTRTTNSTNDLPNDHAVKESSAAQQTNSQCIPSRFRYEDEEGFQ